MERWRERARALKREVLALYLAYRDPRVPWYARAVAACVVAYALSPIDLIPDPVPVLGYLDDLILVPAGIALAIRLVPAAVLDECRVEAARRLAGNRPVSHAGMAAVIVIWLLVAAAGLMLTWRILR